MLGDDLKVPDAATALELLRSKCLSTDIEVNHVWADAIVVAFLREIGHGDVAGAFELVEKWYS